MNCKERFEYWKSNCKDESLLSQLLAMEGNDEAIENAFYKDMEFGTAGIRGIIGAGTNCLNTYTVSRITKGIANYMHDNGYRTVAICRDCRNYSDEFTFCAARVFAQNGIRVVITHDIMPTPFLSYIVRHLKLDIGIMITASHNPPAYNGYKVYNNHGYQLTDEAALCIAKYIETIEPFGIITEPISTYIESGMISYLDDSVVDEYLSAVESNSLGSAEGVSIVYSPLNGTGYKLVPRILRRSGVTELAIVEEQAYPDGNFPTVPTPNPEKREALSYALRLAEQRNYDIVLATDPDADRIAVAVRHEGEYRLLTGNETGALLTDFIFAERKKKETLPIRPTLIKSIVTSPLAAKIAACYGGECQDVLTGFKYIGERITELESMGEVDNFVFGFEESYGYLCGCHVRDKDAVVAAMLIAQMAAKAKREGKTILSRLNQLYQEFGTYQHVLISYEYKGAAGNRRLNQLLSDFRSNLPKALAGSEVISTVDYLLDETGLPKANVIMLDTKEGSRLIVRPSGTEPLIKFYLTASKTSEENAIHLEELTKEVERRFK